jgi:lipoyl(octanoyl) transferase
MILSLLRLLYIAFFSRRIITTSAFRVAKIFASFRCNKIVCSGDDGTPRIEQRSCLMAFQQQLGVYEELQLSDGSLKGWKDRHVRYLDFTKASTISIPISIAAGNDTSEVQLQPGTLVEYNTAWALQKQLLQSHIDRLAMVTVSGNGIEEPTSRYSSSFLPVDFDFNAHANLLGVDTIVLVEHNPVYTLGTGSDMSFILESQKTNQFVPPIVRIDRGGEVTYHGPGQLTVYPIIDLRSYNQDIHWYVRALEEVVVRAINSVLLDDGQLGLVAHREENITGVWIGDCKVAAIGVKCKKWITQHGFAINITPESLQYIENIVPCGLLDRKVGYVNQFLRQRPITVSQMTQHVIQALDDVFQIQLVPCNVL